MTAKSDTSWFKILFNGLPGTLMGLTSLVTAIGVIYIAVINKNASVAAARYAAMADKQAQATQIEVKAVHRLVNSQQTHLLKTIAITTRQLAALTKRPEDEAAAVEAERQYEDRLRAEKEQLESDSKARAKLNP